MARKPRTAPVPTIGQATVLRPDTTLRRLAEWLLVNDGADKPATRGDSHEELVRLAPIRHVLIAARQRHDDSACRACVVTKVSLEVGSHLDEHAAWRDTLLFLKEIAVAVATLQTLQRSARTRVASAGHVLDRAKPTGRMSQPEVIARLRSSAECQGMDRLLAYTIGELELSIQNHLRTFSSPDHAVLPKTNPPRPLIKKITRDLFRVGFTAAEIVRLIDDGHEQNLSSPKSKAFEDAVARVYTRLDGVRKDSAPKSFRAGKSSSGRH